MEARVVPGLWTRGEVAGYARAALERLLDELEAGERAGRAILNVMADLAGALDADEERARDAGRRR